jgi:hypothetical protein
MFDITGRGVTVNVVGKEEEGFAGFNAGAEDFFPQLKRFGFAGYYPFHVFVG